ncbi:uncharacterized protein FIESC28_10249 [Fusarium coffeatum]|uniref:Transcription factor domain-containing protein n=1 Tax=Fusarium coffeatum TaxID=231269 RepID=A0A366QU53_9HYPO|nr:uncharacterized protein FIESC28_10249 [Fusarium coffeatum]RBR08449.1 hypothetical protein FIESC28_10249 [Fusarium coffeatum]
MAPSKTAQHARSSSVDEQSDSSSDNESKQMTSSNTNQLNQSSNAQQTQPVQPAGQQPQKKKKSSAPRVRLDMDLDMELQLKAKIQGDLELAVLRDPENTNPSALEDRSSSTQVDDVVSSIPAEQVTINKEIFERLKRLEDTMFPVQTESIQPETVAQDLPHDVPPSATSVQTAPAQPAPAPAHAAASLNSHEYLVSQLPPLAKANLLFDHFAVTLHSTLLIANNRKTPQTDELLLFFSIFAGACMSWTDELLVKVEATKGEVTSDFDKYFHLAMAMADDSRKPLPQTVTAVAALVNLSHVAINSDDVFPIKALTLRSRCYYMCRAMMIHRLDAPAEQEQRNKADTNVSPNFIDLEVQRRVWWHLVATDWLTAFSGSSQEGVYTIMPKFMNIKKPDHADDITSGGMNLLYRPPAYTITETAFLLQRIRLAEICREIIDALPSMTEDIIEQDYNLIYTLSEKLQNYSHSLPDYLKLNPSEEARTREIWRQRPYIHWQRISLHLGLHARICRLNRPYQIESYAHKEFFYSRVTSLASAHKVLELRRMMDDPQTRSTFKAERYWAILQHVTTAAVTLAFDASLNPDKSGAEISRQSAMKAYQTLQQSRSDTSILVKGIEKNMRRVISNLEGNDYLRKSTVPEPWQAPALVEDFAMSADYSHQLWTDFLANVPDTRMFDWDSLLNDVELDYEKLFGVTFET